MLEVVVDWIVARVQEWGYSGIFAMMFVESSFVPFPSEVALIPAGYLASKGQMDPVLAPIVRRLQARNRQAVFTPGIADVLEFLRSRVGDGDVVVMMGAGDIGDAFAAEVEA